MRTDKTGCCSQQSWDEWIYQLEGEGEGEIVVTQICESWASTFMCRVHDASVEDRDDFIAKRKRMKASYLVSERLRELVARVDAKRRLLRSFRVEKSEH